MLKRYGLLEILPALIVLLVVIHACALPGYCRDSALDHYRRAIELYRADDLVKAVEELEEAYRLDDDDEDIKHRLALYANNLGVRLADADDNESAVRYYERALQFESWEITKMNYARCLSAVDRPYDAIRILEELAYSDDDARVRSARWTLANTYFKLREFERAGYELEEILYQDEEDANAHLMLARCYQQTEKKREATEHLRMVMSISDDKDLKETAGELLKRLAREAEVEESYDRQKSSHFAVVFDEGRGEEFLDLIIDCCEEAYDDVGRWLKYYPDRQTVVIIFKPDEFNDIYPDSTWAAGLYHEWTIKIPLPPGALEAERRLQLKNTIFHEYTHLLIHLITNGRCPRWLNEGLAENMEPSRDYSGDVEPLRKAAVIGLVPELKDLSANFLSEDLNMINLGYSVARQVVGFIREEWGIYRLHRVLEGIKEGHDLDTLFQDAFGYNLQRLQQRWYLYLERLTEEKTAPPAATVIEQDQYEVPLEQQGVEPSEAGGLVIPGGNLFKLFEKKK